MHLLVSEVAQRQRSHCLKVRQRRLVMPHRCNVLRGALHQRVKGRLRDWAAVNRYPLAQRGDVRTAKGSPLRDVPQG